MLGVFIRYFLPFIIVGALIWGAVQWRQNDINHWKLEGRAELQAEMDEAKRKADEATRARQREIRKKTEVEENEVRKAQGADAPASHYLRGVLSRMQRQNHQGERRDSRRSTVNP